MGPRVHAPATIATLVIAEKYGGTIAPEGMSLRWRPTVSYGNKVLGSNLEGVVTTIYGYRSEKSERPACLGQLKPRSAH